MEILVAKKREILGKKVRRLRSQAILPGILYGKGKKNIPLQMSILDFKKVFQKAGTSLIALDVEGEKDTAFLHALTKNPITDEVDHVDFQAVSSEQIIEAEIPLNFEGISSAVKDEDGILVKNMNEIKVSAKAKDLVSKIDVDISGLRTFEDLIKVKDIKVPDYFEVLEDPELVVAMVQAPRTQEELAALEEEVVEKVEEIEGVKKVEAVEQAPPTSKENE